MLLKVGASLAAPVDAAPAEIPNTDWGVPSRKGGPGLLEGADALLPEPPPGRGSSQFDGTTQALLREDGSRTLDKSASSV
jgi:hypothetical protein